MPHSFHPTVRSEPNRVSAVLAPNDVGRKEASWNCLQSCKESRSRGSRKKPSPAFSQQCSSASIGSSEPFPTVQRTVHDADQLHGRAHDVIDTPRMVCCCCLVGSHQSKFIVHGDRHGPLSGLKLCLALHAAAAEGLAAHARSWPRRNRSRVPTWPWFVGRLALCNALAPAANFRAPSSSAETASAVP